MRRFNENRVQLINERAMDALDRGDQGEAYVMLKYNAQKNPCHLTFNNLGQFYWEEGRPQKDGTWVRADALGLRYLRKAAQEGNHGVNLMNLGRALYERKDYWEAYRTFESAARTELGPVAEYNAGACMLAEKDYAASEQIFKNLIRMEHADMIVMRGGVHPSIPLAFSACLAHPSSTDVKQRVLEKLPELPIDVHDRAILLYFCGAYDLVVDSIPSLVQDWALTDELLCMLLDSLRLSTGGDHTHKTSELLDSAVTISSRPRVQRLCKYDSRRKQCIAAYAYKIPLLLSCGYYGCRRHSTPFVWED